MNKRWDEVPKKRGKFDEYDYTWLESPSFCLGTAFTCFGAQANSLVRMLLKRRLCLIRRLGFIAIRTI